jgi:hypothetical protein
MQKEFASKGAFVGVSDLLFDGKNKLPTDGIFKKFKSDDTNFFEVFSPDIRVQSYISGINYKFGLLEKAIGVNKGVLTDMETVDATATAIRRSTADTFALVDDVRGTLSSSFRQIARSSNHILFPHSDTVSNFSFKSYPLSV